MNYNDKVQEILSAHGLDFTIEKAPLIAHNNQGEQMITPYYGLFNSSTNECINTVKEGYTVSQNADVVEMVLRGMEKFGSELTVSKAGSINGGRRVFMQLAIEGDSKVGDDIIKRYVTIIDSNDGSTGLSVGIGDEVAHCENQFFKFYKSGEAKFRHTATLNEKIKSIPMLIETALGEGLRQINIYKKFESTPLTQSLAHKMVKCVLGYDRLSPIDSLTTKSVNRMEILYSNIQTECNIVGNNVWGLFNGLTRFTTHEQSVPKRINGKIESLLVGSAYKKAITGFEFVLNELSLA
jgi:hypothetical protein